MNYIKYISFWLLVISVFAIAYGSRYEILNNKYTSVFIPYKSYDNHDGGIEFRKSNNGHFYIQAEIDGKNIIFLLDTGATDVILSPKDARSLGINSKLIKNFKTYQTANGSIKSGTIEILEMKIGNHSIKNIKASINSVPMSTSLLGMSFLKHFDFAIKNDRLILYPYKV